jgi:hypothetical protein
VRRRRHARADARPDAHAHADAHADAWGDMRRVYDQCAWHGLGLREWRLAAARSSCRSRVRRRRHARADALPDADARPDADADAWGDMRRVYDQCARHGLGLREWRLAAARSSRRSRVRRRRHARADARPDAHADAHAHAWGDMRRVYDQCAWHGMGLREWRLAAARPSRRSRLRRRRHGRDAAVTSATGGCVHGRDAQSHVPRQSGE